MQKRVFTSLALAGFFAATANGANRAPTVAECAVFVVEWPAPQPAKLRIDYFTGLGFINPRPFVSLPTTLTSRGDLELSDFKALWARTGQYSGGFVYLQLLLRWAKKLSVHLGDPQLEGFFVSIHANRLAGREDVSTRLFTMLPSLRDLGEVSETSQAVGLSVNVIGHFQEDLLIEHLDRLEEQLSGNISPRESFGRAMNRLPVRELNVSLRDGAANAQPFITLNFEGFPTKPLLPQRWAVLVQETQTGISLGGSLVIPSGLATEMINDIKVFRAAVLRLQAS